jgi:hypothetical protein
MRSVRLGLGLLLGAVGSAAAQSSFVSPTSLISGVQATGYNFENTYPTQNIEQVAVPLAMIFPIGGRFSVDIGTYYAYTKVQPTSGASQSLSGFTDTQLRASYVMGRDAVVASFMVNVPTGKKTAQNSLLLGYAGNNFLLFPVNAYTNGTSVTGGLAFAKTTGGWNLGIAGSARYNTEYKPFSDVDSTYQPGLEGRFRVGADRLVGRSRLQAGFTFSTFGTDQAGGVTVGFNQPGNRYISELSLTSPVGAGSMSFYAWDFYRGQNGAVTSTAVSHENIFTGGVSSSFPMGRKLAFEPGVEARLWTPNDGMGNFFSANAGLRWTMGSHLTFTPAGRFGFGKIRAPGASVQSNLTGWQANGLLRFTF